MRTLEVPEPMLAEQDEMQVEQDPMRVEQDQMRVERGITPGGARVNAGGASENAGSVRENAGGSRANAGGARANAGGTRENAGGARENAGGARENAGGARENAGGARENSGGARQNAGGARSGAGGPRSNAGGSSACTGGARSNAGRPRRAPTATEVVNAPDEQPIVEQAGPVAVAGISANPAQGVQIQPQSVHDMVEMIPVGESEAGILDIYYAWDRGAEYYRGRENIPSRYERSPYHGRRRCSRCGSKTNTAGSCPHSATDYVLRIHSCKFCCSVLFGSETNGVCCGKRRATDWGVSFRRYVEDPELARLYRLRPFLTRSIEMNAMFCTVKAMMDMKFVRGMGPSFLKLHGNAAMVLPVQDTRYTFLWSTGGFHFDDEARHPSGLIRSAVRDANFKYLVERIYDRLKRYLDHLRDRHQRIFEAGQYTQSAGQVDVVGVSEEVVEEGVRVSEYRGQSSGEVQTGDQRGPFAHDRSGLPTFLLDYTATPRGVFREDGSVVQL